MQFELPLLKPIPAGLVEELVKKSVYCSTHLRGLQVIEEGAKVRLTVDHPGHAAAVGDKVTRFIATLVQGYRKFDRKIIFRNDIQPAYAQNVWEELLHRRWVIESGFGQVGLAGPALGLYHYLEQTFVAMAERHFAAKEFRFPTLLPAGVLGRCGYFKSFPHAITFASHLVGDFDLLDEFSRANQAGPLRFPNRDSLQEPAHCLTPVVCYHCYRTLEHQAIPEKELRIFTAVGSCFRYESLNTTSMERLWDFTLREIVFVGGQENVKKQRQKCIDLVAEWINRIGLHARFETASDPFFTSDFSEKTYFQLLSDLKYEMRVHISAERTLAAGSFNLHNDFFGKTFFIRSGNGPAFSGCVGFGLERWVYAFFCQKGLDPAGWPDEVREFLKDRGRWA
jgi:seryl-tRNA synthetase